MPFSMEFSVKFPLFLSTARLKAVFRVWCGSFKEADGLVAPHEDPACMLLLSGVAAVCLKAFESSQLCVAKSKARSRAHPAEKKGKRLAATF